MPSFTVLQKSYKTWFDAAPAEFHVSNYYVRTCVIPKRVSIEIAYCFEVLVC
jgi:hypothetical protein